MNSLQEAARKIEEQAAIIEQMSTAAGTHASVVLLDKGLAVLSDGNRIFECPLPAGMRTKVGATLVVDAETGAIIRPAFSPIVAGQVVTARTAGRPNSLVEIISEGGGTAIVSTGEFTVKDGDRLTLDRSRCVVVHRLPRPEIAKSVSPGVKWADIGGQTDAKQALIEAIEHPRKYPQFYEQYGKRPIKGVLLHGPTGCGKTLLAKAVATSLSKNGSIDGFIFIKGPEVLDPYVGVAEANVREIFTKAREYKDKTGEGAVIFVDEAEAIMGSRRSHSINGMEKTIVPQFLTEMDGIQKSDALVILATNLPENIDSAILRDSRIDRKIQVGRPSQSDAVSIINQYLSKTPMAKGVDRKALVEEAAASIYDAKRAYYRVTFTGNETRLFSLSDLASGALIEGVVEKATARALRRDIEAKKVSGLQNDDLLSAVQDTFVQNYHSNHDEALAHFSGERKIVNLSKVDLHAA